jgi:hypothetical protein
LLALGADDPGRNVLRKWPAAGGLLLEREGGEPNFGFHGVALLALRARGIDHHAGNAALLAGVQQVKGIALAPSPIFKQDNTLQAWSWIAGTFSWVEPTAWCLLALKKWASALPTVIDGARVDVAERLILDRTCQEGGWNYGTSAVMGQQLNPFIPTTAIALLAMQDRSSNPLVERSQQYLEAHATSERSGIALALALSALRARRAAAAPVADALRKQVPTVLAVGNQLSAALALYALGEERHDALLL